jgi:hypothetical protein
VTERAGVIGEASQESGHAATKVADGCRRSDGQAVSNRDPTMNKRVSLLAALGMTLVALSTNASSAKLQKAYIDGSGVGWRDLTSADFQNANVDPGTFTWKGNGFDCTGIPNGVTRSKRPYTNLEMVARWRHLKPAGNSGIYVWAVEESINKLKRNQFPQGIECQVLDNGYSEKYERETGKKAEWFTTHGDVFPTSGSKMTPYPPASPDGSRGFPRENRSRSAPEWNHYYIRAINGEVRLWVNGKEVSGGKDCDPRTGLLCFESEGSPTAFRDLRIRELP